MKVKGLVKNAATKAPLAGVKVVLTVGERELAVLFSDREGHFEHMEEKEYVGQKLNCRVEKEGFEPQEATYKIGPENIRLDMELVPEKRVEKKVKKIELPKWAKIAMGVAAVIVAAIVIYLVIPPEPGLKIVYFKADPATINKGRHSTLTWETQNAVTLTIDEIGKVKPSGSGKVRPQKTTTYTLIAKDKTNERSKTCKVEVRVLEGPTVVALPDLYISEFSLSPSTPTQGKPVNVRIGVYNRGSAKARPFTVEWWAGENFPKPAKVWQVDGSAARGGRILTYTYDGYPSWYGRITTKAVADSKGKVKEQNEGNNVKKIEIKVRKKESPTVAALPDLYISEFSLSPSTPTQGKPVKVRIGVYNRGSAKARPFTVEWWAGENFPRPAKVWQVDGSAARGGRILTYTYDGYRSWYGKLTTKAVADSKGKVKEQNEGNNVKRMEIKVQKKQ